MATYDLSIWNNGVPVLLVGGSPAFDIWTVNVPYVQNTESGAGAFAIQAYGSSAATVAFEALYSFAVQASGDSSASVSFTGIGDFRFGAVGKSTASVALLGTGAFGIFAAGDSDASISLIGEFAFSMEADGDSSATVQLGNKPFVYPPTLIFGF